MVNRHTSPKPYVSSSIATSTAWPGSASEPSVVTSIAALVRELPSGIEVAAAPDLDREELAGGAPLVDGLA